MTPSGLTIGESAAIGLQKNLLKPYTPGRQDTLLWGYFTNILELCSKPPQWHEINSDFRQLHSNLRNTNRALLVITPGNRFVEIVSRNIWKELDLSMWQFISEAMHKNMYTQEVYSLYTITYVYVHIYICVWVYILIYTSLWSEHNWQYCYVYKSKSRWSIGPSPSQKMRKYYYILSKYM